MCSMRQAFSSASSLSAPIERSTRVITRWRSYNRRRLLQSLPGEGQVAALPYRDVSLLDEQIHSARNAGLCISQFLDDVYGKHRAFPLFQKQYVSRYISSDSCDLIMPFSFCRPCLARGTTGAPAVRHPVLRRTAHCSSAAPCVRTCEHRARKKGTAASPFP